MKGKLGYKVRTITCINCGKVVTGHMSAGQKYCSLNCYRSSPKPGRKTGQELSCAVCAEPVYIPAGRLGKDAYFCSADHANEWQGRNKVAYTCKVCGEAFRWSPSRAIHDNPTYCSLRCRDIDPDRKAMLIAMNAMQQTTNPNKVEIAGYTILDDLGVLYERQHVIGGKFCVDAFVQSHGLVIQWDGDYWHGNPASFPEPDSRQRKRMMLDRSQDASMAACGYRVVRFWASTITKHPEVVIAHLQALLAQTVPTPAVPA